MGKYLVIWEQVPGAVPTSPKEAGPAILALIEMVEAGMKNGSMKDWGAFLGESKGYTEGTEVEAITDMLHYAPFLKFEVHPVATVAQVAEAVKAWMK